VRHILRRIAFDDEDFADVVFAQVRFHRQFFIEIDVHGTDMRHDVWEIRLRLGRSFPAAQRETKKIRYINDVDFFFVRLQQFEVFLQGCRIARHQFD